MSQPQFEAADGAREWFTWDGKDRLTGRLVGGGGALDATIEGGLIWTDSGQLGQWSVTDGVLTTTPEDPPAPPRMPC